jgi:hypothetical protein
MTYEEMERILTGKQRGKKTTKRNNTWIFSKFEVDLAELQVATLRDDQPGAGKRIDVDASMHFRTRNTDVGSRVRVLNPKSDGGDFAVIDFTSTETMIPFGERDDVVKVNQSSRVFLDTEHLVVLRDQLNEAIRKAKKDGDLV